MRLELRGITKRFGSLLANDHIDLTVEPGEIHALLGENGAGKSTLMNVLYGLLEPDDGEILIDGRPASFSRPKDAIAAGIGMVHQHFMLVPVFTVAENVVLGVERTHGPRPPRPPAGAPGRAAGVRGVRPRRRPDAHVENLPVGVQQRVEIIKALLRDANVLILDEPTAVLTPGETEDLFRVMRSLKAPGGRSSSSPTSSKRSSRWRTRSRSSARRRGDRLDRRRRPPTSELASMMVGRAVKFIPDKAPGAPGEVGARGPRPGRRQRPGQRRRRRVCHSTSGPARSSASPGCRATARPSCAKPSSGCARSARADRLRSRSGYHRRPAA